MAELPEASSSATWTVFSGHAPDLNLNDLDRRKFLQRFLDGRGVIESVLRPEGSWDTGNGPKSPWRRKTGKRRSRLRLCARERRRPPGNAAMLEALAAPATSARAGMPGWLGEEVDTPAFPRQTGAPSVGFDLPETIERSILMQNQEAGIASPQVAATVQSNRQYHQNSEIVQHRPCVTQRQFWRGPPRRNVRAWHPRRQRTLAP